MGSTHSMRQKWGKLQVEHLVNVEKINPTSRNHKPVRQTSRIINKPKKVQAGKPQSKKNHSPARRLLGS